MAKKAAAQKPVAGRGKKKASKAELLALAQEQESQPPASDLSEAELVPVPISGPSSAGDKLRSTIKIAATGRVPSPTPESSTRWADRVMAEQEQYRSRNEGIKLKQNPNFTLQVCPLAADTEVSFSDEELDEGVK